MILRKKTAGHKSGRFELLNRLIEDFERSGTETDMD